MTKDVRACGPEDSLNDAARWMWEVDCGSLPVVDDEKRVIGWITDRDICMSTFFHGDSLSRVRVREAMASQIHSCRPADPIERALETMAAAQVRRLPVVDVVGRLQGLVSMSDLVRASAQRDGPPAARLLQSLAAISEPRRREPDDLLVPERPAASARVKAAEVALPR